MADRLDPSTILERVKQLRLHLESRLREAGCECPSPALYFNPEENGVPCCQICGIEVPQGPTRKRVQEMVRAVAEIEDDDEDDEGPWFHPQPPNPS